MHETLTPDAGRIETAKGSNGRWNWCRVRGDGEAGDAPTDFVFATEAEAIEAAAENRTQPKS